MSCWIMYHFAVRSVCFCLFCYNFGQQLFKKYFHSFGIYSKKDFAVLVSQTLLSSQVTDSSVWLLSQGYILSQGPAFLTSL